MLYQQKSQIFLCGNDVEFISRGTMCKKGIHGITLCSCLLLGCVVINRFNDHSAENTKPLYSMLSFGQDPRVVTEDYLQVFLPGREKLNQMNVTTKAVI